MGVSKDEHPRTPGPKTAIGIDFGSSKCCVGLVRDGKVEILENERGNRTTPSFVAFTEAERLVGESARDQIALNPTNTVFDAKRLLGRKGETLETITALVEHLPYNVTLDNGGVRITVAYKGKQKKLSPEQIAAMLLSQMKKLAEKHLDSPVREAVIAVPAHFNNAQRRALKNAGTIAGLTVLGLISETTAAAVAYQDGKTFAKKQNVLVVDIRGGALNAAVVEVQNASVEVKAICGTSDLSGGKLDRVLVEHQADIFTKLNKIDVKGNKKAFERLRTACQKVKHALTLLPKTVVQVDCLVEEKDLSGTVTRAEFDKKILSTAHETIKKVLDHVLFDASLTPPQINEIVLIGGTTRVPAIQEALVEFFTGKPLNKTVNPDEAVAHGAALQAALLAGHNNVTEIRVADKVKNPVKLPPHLRNRVHMEKLLQIPQKGCEYVIYFEYLPNYRSTKNTRLNHFLDSFGVYSPRGNQALIEDLKKSHVDVRNIQGYLTEKEVCIMTRQLEEFDKEDAEYHELIFALSDLEALCFSVKEKLTSEGEGEETVNGGVSPRLKALGFCDETLDWLDLNELSSINEYKNRNRKLQNLFAAAEDPVIDKTKSFSNKVDEQKAVKECKATQEKVANGVKVVELVEKTAPPCANLSNTLAGNDCISQSKVSIIESPPECEYSNTNSNHTKPPGATSASEVVESPRRDNGIESVKVVDTATVCKLPLPGMSIPVSTYDVLSKIAGESFNDSTQAQHKLQSNMLDYRDPIHEDIDKNEEEIVNFVSTGLISADVRDDPACNDQRISSVNSDGMESLSQAMQSIRLDSEETDSVIKRGPNLEDACSSQFEPNSDLSAGTLYPKALELFCTLQLSDGLAPAAEDIEGQTVLFDDFEPMEVGEFKHCVRVCSEVISNDVGRNERILQNQRQQELECSPYGTISQESLPQGHIGQPTNVSGPKQHDGAHHVGWTGRQHHGHHSYTSQASFNGLPTSSGTFNWPPPPPAQHQPLSYPSNQMGYNHGHSPCTPDLSHLCLDLRNITDDHLRLSQAALALKMAEQYINYRHETILNSDPSSYPSFVCIFCYYSYYPSEIHRFLRQCYEKLAGCALTTCPVHAHLLHEPHYS